MPYYLIELYSPTSRWLELPVSQRQDYLAQVQVGMSQLSGHGIEVLSLGPTTPAIDQASEHRFLGIWKFDTPEARDALLAGIRASSWYDYFDHINASGKAGDFASHLAELAAF